MRELKFRVWHVEGEEAEMIYSDSYEHNTPGDTLSDFFSDCFGFGTDYMQYTGLKDKNGVEIYEGDILKLDGLVCLVDWLQGGFILIGNEINGEHIGPQVIYDNTSEVIGNIHQNPELLK